LLGENVNHQQAGTSCKHAQLSTLIMSDLALGKHELRLSFVSPKTTNAISNDQTTCAPLAVSLAYASK
jgi:hypothetical protein